MRKFLFVFFALSALLQACSGGGELRRGQAELEAKKEASAWQTRSSGRIAMLAMQNAPAPETDYDIGPDDVLDVRVFQTGDLGGIVRVSPDYLIDLPLVGEVSTRGMTPTRLEKALEKKLAKYIKDPFVSVTVKEYRAQRVSVVGAVMHPQVYTMNGPKYLLDMLAEAGGLSQDAGQFCTVMRAGPGQPPSKVVIDLSELLDKGDLALNVPILGGDVINVQKAGMVYIDGEVGKADAYPLRNGTTLVKVIAMAQGLKKDADNSGIEIYRDNGRGGRDIIKADYDAINKGKARDIRLAENDIIIVPASGTKTVLYGLLNTIRGYFNFGNFAAGGGYAQ